MIDYTKTEIILTDENNELFDWPTTIGLYSNTIIIENNELNLILTSIINNDSNTVLLNMLTDNKIALDFTRSQYINGVSIMRLEPDGFSYVEITENLSYGFFIDNNKINLQFYFNIVENFNELQTRKYFIKIKLNKNAFKYLNNDENQTFEDFKNIHIIMEETDPIFEAVSSHFILSSDVDNLDSFRLRSDYIFDDKIQIGKNYYTTISPSSLNIRNLPDNLLFTIGNCLSFNRNGELFYKNHAVNSSSGLVQLNGSR